MIDDREFLYLPGGVPAPIASVLPGDREVVASTEDGLDFGAWFTPAHEATESAAGLAVLVCNGNAGDRSLRAAIAAALAARGFAALA
jgi:hypothetical protein